MVMIRVVFNCVCFRMFVSVGMVCKVLPLQTIAAYLRVHLGRLDKKLEKPCGIG